MERTTIEGIIASVFVAWLAWSSWEIVNIKSDRNVEDQIHAAVLALTKSIAAVNGNLNTEIERSKIIDNRQRDWLKATYELANHNKGRIITLEVKQQSDHGR